MVNDILEDGLVVESNEYVDVTLCMFFTEVTLAKVDGMPSDLFAVELGAVVKVDLKLCEVENKHFQNSILAIPQRHSAGLRPKGEGIELIQQALKSRGPREHVPMRASIS